MVDFCPECGSILRKGNIEDRKFLVCKCGYKKPVRDNEYFGSILDELFKTMMKPIEDIIKKIPEKFRG